MAQYLFRLLKLASIYLLFILLQFEAIAGDSKPKLKTAKSISWDEAAKNAEDKYLKQMNESDCSWLLKGVRYYVKMRQALISRGLMKPRQDEMRTHNNAYLSLLAGSDKNIEDIPKLYELTPEQVEDFELSFFMVLELSQDMDLYIKTLKKEKHGVLHSFKKDDEVLIGWDGFVEGILNADTGEVYYLFDDFDGVQQVKL